MSTNNILTIYALGTGESAKRASPTLLKTLYEYTEGPKLILDGPGGSHVGERKTGPAEKITGQTLGYGVDDRVNQAVAWIKQELQARGDSTGANTKLNLAGFSRGGALVTTAIANRLRTELPAMEIPLMFNDDPVAGMGRKAEEQARVIPSNVKNYVVTLSENERRNLFKPQDMSRVKVEDVNSTAMTFLVRPGHHAVGVIGRGKVTDTAAKITRYTAATLLKKHGTSFRPYLDKDSKQHPLPPFGIETKEPGTKREVKLEALPDYSSKELLEVYNDIKHHMPQYEKLSKTLGPMATRSFLQRKEEYVLGSHYFTNQQEREAFKETYPKVFNYYFEQNQKLPEQEQVFSADDVKAELKIMRAEVPNSYETFVQRIKPFRKDGSLSEPQGYNYIEPMRFKNGLKLGYTDLEKFYFEATHIATIYQRDQRHQNINNVHHGRAEKIRKEAFQIMYNTPENDSVKLAKMKKMVEKHLDHMEKFSSGHSRLYQNLSNLMNRDIKIKHGLMAKVGSKLEGLSIHLEKNKITRPLAKVVRPISKGCFYCAGSKKESKSSKRSAFFKVASSGIKEAEASRKARTLEEKPKPDIGPKPKS